MMNGIRVPAPRPLLLRTPAPVLLLAAALATILPVEASAHESGLERPLAFGRDESSFYGIAEPNLFVHDAGLLRLQITNVGIVGNPFSSRFSAEWRGNEYLYLGGLWIGAIGKDSVPHVSTADSFELRPEIAPAWTIYRSYQGAPGGNRVGDGGYCSADDDHDGCSGADVVDPALIDEDFQNGLDDDGDGQVDEDFEALGQQMFSCSYRDDAPEVLAQEPGHFPLGILVRQRSIQWSGAGAEGFVGFDYRVENVGDQRLHQVFLGLYTDADIGPKTAPDYGSDDLVGWACIDTAFTDSNLPGACASRDASVDAAYMWDAAASGRVPGVIGTAILGHATDPVGFQAPAAVGITTLAWFTGSDRSPGPANDEERFALLNSRSRPRSDASEPGDYRYVAAVGPFLQLDPGESMRFQIAYVVGDGQAGFRAGAARAKQVFDGRYVDADQDPSTGVQGKETCIHALDNNSLVNWDDPCDTLATFIVIKGTHCYWVDGDCNPCTGTNGEETPIRWVAGVAPPAPNTNTDSGPRPLPDPNLSAYVSPAGDHRAIIQWDDSSEHRPDPITGVNYFQGYRVWRADGWARPAGSIGPEPGDWMQLVEFRRDPGTAAGRVTRNLDEALCRGVQPGSAPRPSAGSGGARYYCYSDTSELVNGKVYFYAVTAFGLVRHRNPGTTSYDTTEVAGLPAAIEAAAVIPRWDAAAGCSDVRVVPNPYRGSAAWDLGPGPGALPETRIAFRNLPPARSTIRVFTLAGDLVVEAEHDGTGGDGTWFWDLASGKGRTAASGLYLYSVEYPGGTCRGRFAIIR